MNSYRIAVSALKQNKYFVNSFFRLSLHSESKVAQKHLFSRSSFSTSVDVFMMKLSDEICSSSNRIISTTVSFLTIQASTKSKKSRFTLPRGSCFCRAFREIILLYCMHLALVNVASVLWSCLMAALRSNGGKEVDWRDVKEARRVYTQARRHFVTALAQW